MEKAQCEGGQREKPREAVRQCRQGPAGEDCGV